MKKQSGSGLIFAVVLLFVILGMVITLSSVTVLETKMNQKTKSSVGAFYNSESGVEWALNKIANSNSDNFLNAIGLTYKSDGSVTCPVSPDCNVFFLDKDGKVIDDSLIAATKVSDIKAVRSVGTQGGETQRAIEAAVAATGGGCYVSNATIPNYSGVANCSGDACCLSNFKNKGSVGKWGFCHNCGDYSSYQYLKPPGMNCSKGWCYDGDVGESFVCCQN